MALRYDNPREIGADRLVNAVAAYDRVERRLHRRRLRDGAHLRPGQRDGEYLGGIISPGVEISLEALYSRAAKLPRIDLGAAAHADRQVHDRRDPLRHRLRLRGPGRRDPAAPARRARASRETIATGGLAEHIVPVLRRRSTTVDDLLTLNGPAAPARAQRDR